jgi:hypothetical protein
MLRIPPKNQLIANIYILNLQECSIYQNETLKINELFNKHVLKLTRYYNIITTLKWKDKHIR